MCRQRYGFYFLINRESYHAQPFLVIKFIISYLNYLKKIISKLKKTYDPYISIRNYKIFKMSHSEKNGRICHETKFKNDSFKKKIS